jgi:hypothetical protein
MDTRDNLLASQRELAFVLYFSAPSLSIVHVSQRSTIPLFLHTRERNKVTFCIILFTVYFFGMSTYLSGLTSSFFNILMSAIARVCGPFFGLTKWI